LAIVTGFFATEVAGIIIKLHQRNQSARMIGSAATGWARISSWTTFRKAGQDGGVNVIGKAGHHASIHQQVR
jgi:hypothetical protein